MIYKLCVQNKNNKKSAFTNFLDSDLLVFMICCLMEVNYYVCLQHFSSFQTHMTNNDIINSLSTWFIQGYHVPQFRHSNEFHNSQWKMDCMLKQVYRIQGSVRRPLEKFSFQPICSLGLSQSICAVCYQASDSICNRTSFKGFVNYKCLIFLAFALWSSFGGDKAL